VNKLVVAPAGTKSLADEFRLFYDVPIELAWLAEEDLKNSPSPDCLRYEEESELSEPFFETPKPLDVILYWEGLVLAWFKEGKF